MPTTESRPEPASGLTPAELQFLRERLERLRDDLRVQLRRNQEVAQSAEPSAEALDAAEQTREQDDAVLFGERDRALLREVEHALAKLDTGDYGVSEASGRPIGFRRLEAIPWARFATDETPGMPPQA